MFQRHLRTASLVASIALATAGCGVIYKQPIYQGNLLETTAVEQLQAGMSREQVITLLGTPSIADPFHQSRWDYTATQRIGRAGRTQSKNLTLHFDGDSLTKWEGDYFPEQDEQIAKNSMRQFGRNLAKDKDKDKRRRR